MSARPLAAAAPDPVALPRLLPGDPRRGRPAAYGDHLARHGPLPLHGDTRWLIDEVERAGLTGRGGAGFPTARKLQAVAAGRGSRVVVANGAEAEPASRKDRFLLSVAPHLVVDGALAAAAAIGAREVLVCVARGEAAEHTLALALAERARGGSDRLPVRVVGVPHRYVAGEESALVRFLGGGPAKPTFVPPRPFERGVRGRPTLVDNVETLAHVALIARHGAAWFRGLGAPTDPGSTLVTIGGAVARPGVAEVARDATVGDVLALAGGPTGPLQAVLLGGYSGAWASAEEAVALPVTGPSGAGGGAGAGVVVALPRGACGLAETARVLGYLARESAGQCGPCRHGLPAVAEDLAALARAAGRPRGLSDRVAQRLTVIAGRGACHHPDGAVRLAASALHVFARDLRHHERSGPCAGAQQAPLLPVPSRRDGEEGWR